MKMPCACIGILSIGLALAGCTKPEDEAPIAMKAGLYEVSLGGPLPGMTLDRNTPGAKLKPICVGGEAEFIPEKLVQSVLQLGPKCSTASVTRKGNALSAISTCQGEHSSADSISMTYEARVASEELTGSAHLKADLHGDSRDAQQARQAGAVIGLVPISIGFKRTGECNASGW